MVQLRHSNQTKFLAKKCQLWPHLANLIESKSSMFPSIIVAQKHYDFQIRSGLLRAQLLPFIRLWIQLGFSLKTFLTFVPCAVISGLLCYEVLRKLRKSEHSKREHLFTCVLWLAWLLLNLPVVAWETWLQTSPSAPVRYDQYWDVHFIFVHFTNYQQVAFSKSPFSSRPLLEDGHLAFV